MATSKGIKFLVLIVLFSFNFYRCFETSGNLGIAKKIEDLAIGKYKMDSTLDCENYLVALDVGYFIRKAAASSKPEMEVTEEGGQWTIKTSTVLTSVESKFKLGEKTKETLNGNEYESIAFLEGNKFITITTPTEEGLKSTKSVREFTDEGCTMTTNIIGTDFSCVQEFERF